MTQLGMGVAALNHDSAFAAAYEKGMQKTDYWTYTYEDSINLLAKLPALAARIYRNIYKAEEELPAVRKDLDLVGTCLDESAKPLLANPRDQGTILTCLATETART
jgi:citrate synthase